MELCSLFITVVIVLIVYSRWDRAVHKFQMRCGECRYSTGWTKQSAAEATLEAHYATRHPGLPSRGLVEWR
ncbi:hypothetical protein [Nocardia sp. X0981]